MANKTVNLDVNQSVLTVACGKATSATIQLDNGSNSAHASGTTRAMASGANYLSYEIYTSNARTTVWDSSNTVSFGPTTTMASTTLPVYGRIPFGQDATVASYTDSVTATVNF